MRNTVLTVGVYSEYVDAELLVGSVSATLGFENGTLKLVFFIRHRI